MDFEGLLKTAEEIIRIVELNHDMNELLGEHERLVIRKIRYYLDRLSNHGHADAEGQ